MKLKIPMLLLILGSVFMGSCSCDGGTDVPPDDTRILLDFVLNFNYAGVPNVTQKVERGTPAIQPEDPSRAGYTFDGWYETAIFGSDAYIWTKKVSMKTTVFAHWTAEIPVEGSHTIKFDLNYEGAPSIPSETIPHLKSVTAKDDPVWTGHTFAHWSLSQAADEGVPYIFGSPVTASFTIYAKWDSQPRVQHDVIFDINYATTPKTITSKVYEGDLVRVPSEFQTLYRTGYNLNSWTRNADGTSPFDIITPITESITLYAKWETISASNFNVVFSHTYLDAPPATTRTVPVGTKATPEVPSARPEDDIFAYQFKYWAEIGVPYAFDFNTPITKNYTLVSVWSAKELSSFVLISNFDSTWTSEMSLNDSAAYEEYQIAIQTTETNSAYSIKHMGSVFPVALGLGSNIVYYRPNGDGGSDWQNANKTYVSTRYLKLYGNIGGTNHWNLQSPYVLSINPGNYNEFVLFNLALTTSDEFKIVEIVNNAVGTWYNTLGKNAYVSRPADNSKVRVSSTYDWYVEAPKGAADAWVWSVNKNAINRTITLDFTGSSFGGFNNRPVCINLWKEGQFSYAPYRSFVANIVSETVIRFTYDISLAPDTFEVVEDSDAYTGIGGAISLPSGTTSATYTYLAGNWS